MKHIHLTLAIFFAATLGLALAACNDDNPEAGPTTGGGNANSNATRVFNGVTENPQTTDVHQAATRLEMPQLNRTGENNLFIVHTVSTGINYSMEYDCDLKAQRWAAYRWDASNIRKAVNRTDAWNVDPLIPQEYQTTNDDYSNSGYTRGHIVASEDRVYSREANEQTFYYSNMHPQLYGFNTQGIWWKAENELIRDRYCKFDQGNSNYFCDTLYVVKGGTIAPVNINGKDTAGYTWAQGRGQRLVCPRYFFMALLRKSSKDTTQGGYAAIGFWMEHKSNTDSNYRQYAVSIDELERLTGIDFFCNLPDNLENQVESNLVLSVWKI